MEVFQAQQNKPALEELIDDNEEYKSTFEKSAFFDEHCDTFSSEFDVNRPLVVTNPKSLFVLSEQKIDVDSIYDNQTSKVNKTRFGALPTKLEKTNMPVTFHKKIKSSGYSAAPGSLKYTSKVKQKAKEQKSPVLVQISCDFYSKPLPMSI